MSPCAAALSRPTRRPVSAWLSSRLGALAALLLTAVHCPLLEQVRRSNVRLSSGDTVVIASMQGDDALVVVKDEVEFFVRLIGVQAFDPVLSDAYVQTQSARAKGFLEAWQGRHAHVYLETAQADASGRYWGYVQSDLQELNLQMVRGGIAPVYTEFRFSHEAAYLAAEAQAREASLGLWGDPQSMAVVSGLRLQWRRARQAHHAAVLPDPLVPNVAP